MLDVIRVYLYIYIYILYKYIYKVHINYLRISLCCNSSRKCYKFVKFVLITHSECNIQNGPTVATAIFTAEV
jgi:hypothetical protein